MAKRPKRSDPVAARRREIPRFSRKEFEQRVERACRLMARDKLDGLLVTAEANIEYLTGFTTQFAWNTPTRPWYFVLSRTGRATAVIPEIGLTNWQDTSWVDDVHTWPSPRPQNEGLDLVKKVVGKIRKKFGRLGLELGPESRMGLPAGDLLRLKEMISKFELVDGFGIMRELLMIKSPAEIARVGRVCQVVSEAFENLPAQFQKGDNELDLARKFQADMLLKGADKTPFIAMGSGRGGYSSIIKGPTTRKLSAGDVFFIDTGARYDGYFSDFCRNFAVGKVSNQARRIYEILYRVTEAGIQAIRPGNTTTDICKAQVAALAAEGMGAGNVGRMGHGLGKILTEPPSVTLEDNTPLVPGMVITVEPSAMFGRGKIMAHEENLVVTEGAPKLLSRRAAPELPCIDF